MSNKEHRTCSFEINVIPETKTDNIQYLSQMTINSSNKCNSEIISNCKCNRSDAGVWPRDDRLSRHWISAFDWMVYVMLATVVIPNFKWLSKKYIYKTILLKY